MNKIPTLAAALLFACSSAFATLESPDKPSASILEKPKLLKKADSVGLGGYRVLFTVRDGASAVSHGGEGSKASIGVNLIGVDQKLMQEITEEAYADLKSRLAKIGRPLLDVQKLTGHETFKALEPLKSPFYKDSNTFVVCSPAEIPLVAYAFDMFNGSNIFNQGPTKSLYHVSADNKTALLVPTVMVAFSRAGSSGHSLLSGSANVSITPDLRIAGLYSFLDAYWSDNPRSGQAAHYKMTNGYQLDTSVGQLKEVSKENSNLGLFDTSPWRSAKGSYEWVADTAKYKAEALKGLFAFNESVALAVAAMK